MWSPYIFIDYPIGMVTGREVWGWSKALGKITMPTAAGTPAEFSIRTLIFEEFDAATPGRDETVLKVVGSDALAFHSKWGDAKEAIETLAAAINGLQAESKGAPKVEWIGPDIPAIALKQFRESGSPTNACYQAIVNSPVQITRFKGGGFHWGSFELHVFNCESHQIMKDICGIATRPGTLTTLPVLMAGWMKYDFEALPGSVIHRSV
jgi:hypothetical protein